MARPFSCRRLSRAPPPPVIGDLSGKTGLAIVDAILAGERDPAALARLRDHRIKASMQTIERSLRGDWQPERLFVLK